MRRLGLKRRSKLEITLCVLELISDGKDKPTRIMYGAHMSWNPIQKVLATCVAQGLVNETVIPAKTRQNKRYTITEKGEAVIKYYEGMKDLVGGVI